MRWCTRFVPILMLTLTFAAIARADEFTIDLKAQTGKEPMTASASYPAGDKKSQPRAVLMASAKSPVTVKWTVRNIEKATAKDALVHVFVVKIDKPDQREVPKLTKDVVVQSALTTDFKAEDKAQGEVTFTVANPGIYLLRVEIKKTAAKEEPSAALDIVVR